jgi:hypothetical protein
MVRISFGAYNSFDDVDALLEMLWLITRNEYRGQYDPIPDSGGYAPAGYHDSTADYFSFDKGACQSGAPTHRDSWREGID